MEYTFKRESKHLFYWIHVGPSIEKNAQYDVCSYFLVFSYVIPAQRVVVEVA